jgi:hypothetical protein
MGDGELMEPTREFDEISVPSNISTRPSSNVVIR